jgi:hypothetical protein
MIHSIEGHIKIGVHVINLMTLLNLANDEIREFHQIGDGRLTPHDNWCELVADHLFKHFWDRGQDGNSTVARNIAFVAIFKDWDDEGLLPARRKHTRSQRQIIQNC